MTLAGVSAATDLDVDYSIQSGSNFLESPIPDGDLLEFRESSGSYTATITLDLDDDQADEEDGLVSVEVLSDTSYPFSYKVGTENIGTATVMDDDEPSEATPLITLSAPNYIVEGNSFMLKAMRSHPSNSQIDVDVNLSSDANDNFLAPCITWIINNHYSCR